MIGDSRIIVFVGLAALLTACGGSGGCEGPAVPIEALEALRQSMQGGSGPRGALVIPNPIDASNQPNVMASSGNLLQTFGGLFSLPDLASASRLENSFLKIRIRTPQDDVASLARPNSKGQFNFDILDDHYGETMAYFSIQNMIKYVETLGFSVLKSRPLYVMVNAQTDDPGEVNAFYDHQYFNPKGPRLLRVFGNTEFPLRADRDIFWHEFGHHFTEAATAEVGADLATDAGAQSTEGAGLYECFADILATSVGGKPYIGRWTARNFSTYRPGEPLRSAVDDGRRLVFSTIQKADGAGNSPERYALGEWCSRVLWDVREEMVAQDPRLGPARFERMVFTALGLLKRDTSVSQFHDALLKADEDLYCGGNEDTIKEAFTSRGFKRDVAALNAGLRIDAEPVGIDGDGNIVELRSGVDVVFNLTVGNSAGARARNVRIYLESLSTGLVASTYMQALGDLDPGQVVGIGSGGNLGYEWSPSGVLTGSGGSVIQLRLHVVVENGPTTTITREFQL